MKATSYTKIALLAMTMAMAACHSHKKVVEETPAVQLTPEQQELMKKVESQEQKKVSFLSSKVKFSVSVGDQQLSLTGNLHMKRNDVIRLQLMASDS